MSDMKRLLPRLGRTHDHLNGLSHISNPNDSNANVNNVSFYCIILYPSFLIIFIWCIPAVSAYLELASAISMSLWCMQYKPETGCIHIKKDKRNQSQKACRYLGLRPRQHNQAGEISQTGEELLTGMEVNKHVKENQFLYTSMTDMLR